MRKRFAEAVEQDFEIVKDVLHERPVARGGETYWLVHAKPKRTGHYALKYTCRYTHGREHPEEGESEIFVQVAEAKSRRKNHVNSGLGSFCLGDTIIFPIRMDHSADHRFSLKSAHRNGKAIGPGEQPMILPEEPSSAGRVDNPLEAHLEYLGTVRSVMPHRNAGEETVTWSAVLKAKSAGRFNLGLSTATTGTDPVIQGIPILIISPETPVTAIAHDQRTVQYSDNKRFAAHSGHQFTTNLLILQPGDTFALEYLSQTKRQSPGSRPSQQDTADRDKQPVLSIRDLPFAVDKDWGYNQWLIDHLPPEEGK